MSDQSSNNAARRLGTVLSAIGFAWFLLAILADMGALSELGLPRELIAGLRGNFFTPVILIIAGRSMRKRAKRRAEQGEPQSPRPAPRPAPIPAPRPAPRHTPSPQASRPKPDQSEASGEPTTQRHDVVSLEEALAGLEPETEPAEESASQSDAEQLDGPKTSAEMLDEARRKWGSDRD